VAKPPKSVRAAARRGLKNRRERAKKTKTPGGTRVGVARARDLKNGKNIPPKTLKRMKSFFARHDTAASRKNRNKSPKSRASIAWDLWGGNAGKKWVERELKKREKK
jgi:hypothetical protein